MILPSYPGLVVLRIKYNQTSLVAVRNLAWDFWGGLYLVQGCSWVLIFAPIRSPPSLEIWSTPLRWIRNQKRKVTSCQLWCLIFDTKGNLTSHLEVISK